MAISKILSHKGANLGYHRIAEIKFLEDQPFVESQFVKTITTPAIQGVEGSGSSVDVYEDITVFGFKLIMWVKSYINEAARTQEKEDETNTIKNFLRNEPYEFRITTEERNSLSLENGMYELLQTLPEFVGGTLI